MKKKNYPVPIMLILYLILFCHCHAAEPAKVLAQDDPVLAPDVLASAPTINGIGDDACWQDLPWQTIDQVWIPYNGTVTPDDYSGQYKIVWSSTTNLLYILVEVFDDVIVDDYPDGGGGIYEYDIAEVFIDEDTSGGAHIYDNQFTNAENAFSYHIFAPFPGEGEVTTDHQADDMAGSMGQRIDYTPHLPEFALRRSGDIAVWEFSLIVYNDTYVHTNPAAARVQLQTDKVIGMSVAYCDNDGPEESPKVRDNMFGSVWEPAPGNLHWQNADGYGRIKLVENIPDYIPESKPSVPTGSFKVYPNPGSSSVRLRADNQYRGEVVIRLYNLLGQELLNITETKWDQIYDRPLVLKQLPVGTYFIQMQMGSSIYREKLILAHWK
jgi:hypothetical protein